MSMHPDAQESLARLAEYFESAETFVQSRCSQRASVPKLLASLGDDDSASRAGGFCCSTRTVNLCSASITLAAHTRTTSSLLGVQAGESSCPLCSRPMSPRLLSLGSLLDWSSAEREAVVPLLAASVQAACSATVISSKCCSASIAGGEVRDHLAG
jgi:hypothetical protein